MYKKLKKLNYNICKNYIMVNDYNKDKRICLVINDYDYHHLKISPFFNGDPLLYIIKLNKYKIYKNHIKKILDIYNIKCNFIKDNDEYDKVIYKMDEYIKNEKLPYALLLKDNL